MIFLCVAVLNLQEILKFMSLKKYLLEESSPLNQAYLTWIYLFIILYIMMYSVQVVINLSRMLIFIISLKYTCSLKIYLII